MVRAWMTALPARATLIYTPNSLGLSARGVALANALGGDELDLNSHFYNPAALACTKDFEFGFSYLYSIPRFDGGPVGGPSVTQREHNEIVTVGLRTNISRLFPERFHLPPIALGWSVAVDNNFRTMMIFDDMRDPNGSFDRTGKANMVMQAAAGVGVTPWLGLSAGFHGGFRGDGVVETRADVSGTTANEGTSMRGSFAPVPLFGAYAHGETWGVGATYREETYGAFEAIRVTATPTIADQPLSVMDIPLNFLDTFVPREVVLGTHVDIGDWRVLADLSWREWHRYQEVSAKAHFAGSHARFDTVDLWTPRVGAEWEVSPTWTLRAGYRFEQTPFRGIGTSHPDFDETLKGKVVLDSDTHVFALGAGIEPPIEDWFLRELRIDLAYQYHAMTDRRTTSSDHVEFEMGGGMHLLTATVIFGDAR